MSDVERIMERVRAGSTEAMIERIKATSLWKSGDWFLVREMAKYCNEPVTENVAARLRQMAQNGEALRREDNKGNRRRVTYRRPPDNWLLIPWTKDGSPYKTIPPMIYGCPTWK